MLTHIGFHICRWNKLNFNKIYINFVKKVCRQSAIWHDNARWITWRFFSFLNHMNTGKTIFHAKSMAKSNPGFSPRKPEETPPSIQCSQSGLE